MISKRFASIRSVCYPLARSRLRPARAGCETSSPDAHEAPEISMRVLIADTDIQRRIRELAADIRRDVPADAELHLICVLKGAFLFLADLMRALEGAVTVDFMALSSYGKGTSSSGEVRLLKDLDVALEGRHVLIVEDIVDTGLTLHYLQEILRARGPNSLRTVCLLSKPARRLVDVRVEYIGFTIEDHFVIGYGLDYAELYRNLPYIGVMEG
jgi:hypoxanthine phosphoribosyltransferase